MSGAPHGVGTDLDRAGAEWIEKRKSGSIGDSRNRAGGDGRLVHLERDAVDKVDEVVGGPNIRNDRSAAAVAFEQSSDFTCDQIDFANCPSLCDEQCFSDSRKRQNLIE